MDRVLITGVAGFIGSHVARRFLAEGHHVIGVDDLSNGRPSNIPEGVEFVRLDLSHREAVARLPSGCRRILHLAGQSSGEISFDDPVADLEKNTVSTLNLIQYGMANGAERIVYASSMSVYGDAPDQPIPENHPVRPLSCYGVGKLAAEGYLRVYRAQLPYTALRMFNVYGPGQDMGNLRQGMVSIYLAQALATGRIEVKGSLQRFRDFVYIDDVVEAWWRSAYAREAQNQAINIATGRRTTVSDLLTLICERLAGASYFVKGATPGDQAGIYADTTRMQSLLGIASTRGLDAGLERFVAWARETTKAMDDGREG